MTRQWRSPECGYWWCVTTSARDRSASGACEGAGAGGVVALWLHRGGPAAVWAQVKGRDVEDAVGVDWAHPMAVTAVAL